MPYHNLWEESVLKQFGQEFDFIVYQQRYPDDFAKPKGLLWGSLSVANLSSTGSHVRRLFL
jgi:hypothetical protein